MPVPLALAAPAAVAGLAYLNAKTGFSYDYSLLGPLAKATIQVNRRAKNDTLNPFYILEEHARGLLANKTLLIYDGQRWTYKEVYIAALKYGTWMKKAYGIKSKELVAMDFMNSDKFIFVWFGIWAIGAKPAFINYNLTDKALVHCIKVSTARLVLVDPQVQDNITQEVRDGLSAVEMVIFTPELQSVVMAIQEKREKDSERSEAKAIDMGMIIFTSGTTGLPKGAIVSWNKVIRASLIVPAWNEFSKADTFYTCMPLYHSSASILGFCMVLIEGATICLGRKFSTKTFWVDVRVSDATVIQYVGETCRYLLSASPEIDPATGENLDRQNNVRMAFGNGLRPDIWNRFKDRFGIEAIAEFYTSTEGTTGSWNYSRNDFGKGAVGRLGMFAKFLMRNTSALVELDWETEQPWRHPKTGLCRRVKEGEPGELLFWVDANDIPAKFQGYFNNPSATEGKIMRDVFKKGDAWFHTGDMIFRDSEGRSFFSDRIGDTFRWKAENVSTNEVSEALGHHPKVQEANVYGVELPHHDGRAGCVALVLAEQPNETLLSDLASHARKRLPRFAVPVFLRFINEMQLTGTNKQQKHAIRVQGVDPGKVGKDDLYWLKEGTYVKFSEDDWSELNAGKIRL
ncbi:hypothetical protein BJ875DRAFT_70259 [Amylocarpus encephaloides]|uniref:Very long-chain fatty acid transport protein n=1 Tax=Amylocarpus encephaloides TaxID=45428 RepID=A0A9P8C986_9HELO|nr:hypothetical protein BJ875DRAFT_70259 [Amylocarpus encephaloides]